MVGDSLFQIRARTFNELIEKPSCTFKKQHEKRAKVVNAMEQVTHVPGDLHGGCFRFLSSIYTLFYGALIQPIQALIGWKRMKGARVTKCYQHSTGLALIVASE